MQLTSGQHQQEPFADWLGATAFRAVEFARGKGAKLLRHFTSLFVLEPDLLDLDETGIITSSWRGHVALEGGGRWRRLRLIRWPKYSPRDDLMISTMSRSASRRTTPKKPGNFVSMNRRLKVKLAALVGRGGRKAGFCSPASTCPISRIGGPEPAQRLTPPPPGAPPHRQPSG